MKLKYFSTFTGIGGLDYGLEKMGAECVGFSDIKESSIRIYQKHFPDHKPFGDITKIDPKKMPDFDVFTGGFPCQSFSISGERKGFTDRRGQMIFYIYDILVAKKPEYFVLENVKGIITHGHGKTYKNVIKLLTKAGYFVRCVLLNSANYGSVQGRERIIFIGRRGKDFEEKNPEVIDNTKRFRDIRDDDSSHYKFISAATKKRLEENRGKFSVIGGYDRVNTITTGVSSSGRMMMLVQEKDGKFRNITELEAERIQGFPEGWTLGESTANRWFALGNAVNCAMSEYLFTNYLKDLWWKKK